MSQLLRSSATVLAFLATTTVLTPPTFAQTTEGLVRDLEWRNIGPANMASAKAGPS